MSQAPAATASTATICRKILCPGMKTDAKMARNVTVIPTSRGETSIEGPGASGDFWKPDAKIVTTAAMVFTPVLMSPMRLVKKNTAAVPASTASAPRAINSLRMKNPTLITPYHGRSNAKRLDLSPGKTLYRCAAGARGEVRHRKASQSFAAARSGASRRAGVSRLFEELHVGRRDDRRAASRSG